MLLPPDIVKAVLDGSAQGLELAWLMEPDVRKGEGVHTRILAEGEGFEPSIRVYPV